MDHLLQSSRAHVPHALRSDSHGWSGAGNGSVESFTSGCACFWPGNYTWNLKLPIKGNSPQNCGATTHFQGDFEGLGRGQLCLMCCPRRKPCNFNSATICPTYAHAYLQWMPSLHATFRCLGTLYTLPEFCKWVGVFWRVPFSGRLKKETRRTTTTFGFPLFRRTSIWIQNRLLLRTQTHHQLMAAVFCLCVESSSATIIFCVAQMWAKKKRVEDW